MRTQVIRKCLRESVSDWSDWSNWSDAGLGAIDPPVVIASVLAA